MKELINEKESTEAQIRKQIEEKESDLKEVNIQLDKLKEKLEVSET